MGAENSKLFPEEPVTAISGDYATACSEGEQRDERFSALTMDQYKAMCAKDSSTASEDLNKMASSKLLSERLLLMARANAIGSRNDVSWDGFISKKQEARDKKQKEMDERNTFVDLLSWRQDKNDEDEDDEGPLWLEILNKRELEIQDKACPVDIYEGNALVPVLSLVNEFAAASRGKLGVLVCSDAHRCTAAEMAGCSDVVPMLSMASENFLYKNGCHIPPGGNYLLRSVRISTTIPMIKCVAIVASCADLRTYNPITSSKYNERPKYYSAGGLGSDVKSIAELKERLMTDMIGALKIVLSVAGYERYNHDSAVTAGLYRRVLYAYGSYFRRVVVVVPPSKNKSLYKVYQAAFKPPARKARKKTGSSLASSTASLQEDSAEIASEVATDPGNSASLLAVTAASAENESASAAVKSTDATDEVPDIAAGIPSNDEVMALIHSTLKEVAGEKKEKEEQQMENTAAEEAKAKAILANLERKEEEDKKEIRSLKAKGREKLSEALEMHKSARYSKAVQCYADGLSLWAKALQKMEDEDKEKHALKLNFEKYFAIAEKCKKLAE